MQVVKRLVFLFVVVPLAVILIAFAVANRASVPLSLNPLGDQLLTVQMPLYLIVLAALALGVLTGGVAVWFGQAKWRRAARSSRSEVKRLRADVARTLPPELPAPPGRREAA